jgi:hypothetical protein
MKVMASAALFRRLVFFRLDMGLEFYLSLFLIARMTGQCNAGAMLLQRECKLTTLEFPERLVGLSNAYNRVKSVRPAGVEPTTFGSGGQRSIQLSYRRESPEDNPI